MEPASPAAPEPDAQYPLEPEPLPPPLGAHSVATPELRSAKGAFARSLAALRASAPGIVSVPELDGRPLGRSYRSLEAELGQGTADVVLRRLVRAHLRPSPEDFVFYSEVGQSQVRQADDIIAAFAVRSDLPAAESAALGELAAVIEAGLAASPSIRSYGLRAGWGDAVGAAYHDIALFPAGGEEVLWEAGWSCLFLGGEGLVMEGVVGSGGRGNDSFRDWKRELFPFSF